MTSAATGTLDRATPGAVVDWLRTQRPDVDLQRLEAAVAAVSGRSKKAVAQGAALAEAAARITLDPETTAAALVAGSGLLDRDDVQRRLGDETATLVAKLGQLSKLERVRDPVSQARYLRPMLVAMAGDVRVVVLKLAEVLVRLRLAVRDRKRGRHDEPARQALALHAPLAHRLGIAWLKSELEDLAFRLLQPAEHAALREKLDRTAREREQRMEEVRRDLLRAMVGNEPPIKGRVYGRLKHLLSIQRKLEAQKIHFEQVMDIVAFRILLETPDQCYAALGVIHGMWVPVLGRFKDWIAMPKPNGYRSLHTTVLHPKAGRIEVQIRTEEMHRIAEEGLAAHWRYKERGSGDAALELPWLSRLADEVDQAERPRDARATVEDGLLPDVVYVFTPEGDLRELPAGSTPVDFAYSIHSEIGDHCQGAKVDGRIVPLRHQLKNGDQVTIQTHPRQQPREDWLAFVRTPKARQKVRQRISAERRARAREVGREALDKALRSRGRSLNKLEKKGRAAVALAKESRYRDLDDLILAVGNGKTTAAQATAILLPEEESGTRRGTTTRPDSGGRPVKEGRRPGLKLGGLDDLLVRYARCCSPAAGDEVTGFITRGRGVTVHRADCPRLAELDVARRLDVYWDVGTSAARQAVLTIKARDRLGLLANVTKILQESGIDIASSSSRVAAGHKATLRFTVRAPDATSLTGALRKILRINGVISAEHR